MKAQTELLKSRRFGPLFATQFFGAFNDNVFKNAMVILIAYRLAQGSSDAALLVTAAAGIFILPFFLFSALAGQMADKYEKSRLIRRIKLAEIIIMAAGSMGFYLGSVPWLMAVLFAMGTQSAFFGPLKYAILPDHLEEGELIGGNALVEAGTFLAILLGTIAGGLLILREGGIGIVAALVTLMALLGYLASRGIPAAGPAAPALRLRPNLLAVTWQVMRYIGQHGSVLRCILGISWFWFVGATFLAQFPNYALSVLQADEEVVTLFLTLFSVGIGLGSMLCNRLLKGQVSARLVPLGALGLGLFTALLYFASLQAQLPPGQPLLGAADFLAARRNWGILLSLLMIAVSGGIYIVPLYALMQARAETSHRARVIAGNNIVNALFMVASALAALGLYAAGLSVLQLFLLMGLLNLPVALFALKLARSAA